MMWGLNVQSVVKHFLWNAAHNLLPTKQNLFKKHITESNCCPICEREPETLMHAVWSCPAASDVWAEKDSPVNKLCSLDVVFVDWWVKLNTFLKEEEVEVVACIVRKIWMRRNSFLFEKNFEHPKKLITAATQGLKEFKAAQETVLLLQQKTQLQRKVDRSMIKWEKPEEMVVKANWDAAVDVNNKKVEIGVVVRDSNGEVFAFLCSCFININSPSVAEAAGLRRAALLCTELGLLEVILEGDFKLVVDATISGEEIGAEYGSILEDVRRVMHGRLMLQSSEEDVREAK